VIYVERSLIITDVIALETGLKASEFYFKRLYSYLAMSAESALVVIECQVAISTQELSPGLSK